MLSAHAVEALKEFLSASAAVDGEAVNGSEVKLVTENWNLSQFWYDPDTAQTVAAEVKELCKSDDFRVACPTLDAYLKSKECLEKVAKTISFLAHPSELYLLLLTGEVQKDRAAELLGLRPCIFRPQHSSKLGNEFRLYTNYNPGNRLGAIEACCATPMQHRK